MAIEDLSIDELLQQKDVPVLIEALKHPEDRIRDKAAFVLGRVGDDRAIPALIAALNDPAYTDPSETFRGNSAFEEMGSTDLINYVRKTAWDALLMIGSRTVTTFVKPLPGKNPFKVGDIVAPMRSPNGQRWKVLSITKNEVVLELVQGVFEDGDLFHRKRHIPGFIARISSSDDYRHKFPGTKGNQFAFDSYRKVKLP